MASSIRSGLLLLPHETPPEYGSCAGNQQEASYSSNSDKINNITTIDNPRDRDSESSNEETSYLLLWKDDMRDWWRTTASSWTTKQYLLLLLVAISFVAATFYSWTQQQVVGGLTLSSDASLVSAHIEVGASSDIWSTPIHIRPGGSHLESNYGPSIATNPDQGLCMTWKAPHDDGIWAGCFEPHSQTWLGDGKASLGISSNYQPVITWNDLANKHYIAYKDAHSNHLKLVEYDAQDNTLGASFSLHGQSKSSPSITSADHLLIIAYNGKTGGQAGNQLRYTVFDTTANIFTVSDKEIPGQKAKDAPALTELNGMVIAAHRGATSGMAGNHIYGTTYDPQTDKWGSQTQVHNSESMTKMALVAYGDDALLVHSGTATDQLYFNHYKDGKWLQDDAQIQGFRSNHNVGLAEYNGDLWMAMKDDNSNGLYLAYDIQKQDLRMNVAVRPLEGADWWNTQQIEETMAGLHNAFHKIGISINVVSPTKWIPAPPGVNPNDFDFCTDTLDTELREYGNDAIATNEAASSREGLANNTVAIYLVNEYSKASVAGCAYVGQTLKPFITIGRYPTTNMRNIIAPHEMGHALNLLHVSYAGNYMEPSGPSLRTHNLLWTEDQVDMMRKAPFLEPIPQ